MRQKRDNERADYVHLVDQKKVMEENIKAVMEGLPTNHRAVASYAYAEPNSVIPLSNMQPEHAIDLLKQLKQEYSLASNALNKAKKMHQKAQGNAKSNSTKNLAAAQRSFQLAKKKYQDAKKLVPSDQGNQGNPTPVRTNTDTDKMLEACYVNYLELLSIPDDRLSEFEREMKGRVADVYALATWRRDHPSERPKYSEVTTVNVLASKRPSCPTDFYGTFSCIPLAQSF